MAFRPNATRPRLVKTAPSRWRGNGFGTEAAEYAIEVASTRLAVIRRRTDSSQTWIIRDRSGAYVGPWGMGGTTFVQARNWALANWPILAATEETAREARRAEAIAVLVAAADACEHCREYARTYHEAVAT